MSIIRRIFKRKPYREETLEELMEQLMAEPFVQLEMHLRKLGFERLSDYHNRYRKGGKFKIVLDSLDSKSRMEMLNQYEKWGEKSYGRCIYFYYLNFFVCLQERKRKYRVMYMSDDLPIDDISYIIGKDCKEICNYFGNIGDLNLVTFHRSNQVNELLNGD